MRSNIPSAAEITRVLQSLTHRQVTALVALSGVPFTTLWGIRDGATTNPRIETVRAFLPHVRAAKAS